MQNFRPSETALKVAYGLLALSAKSDWQYRLPEDLAELTETLILEAGVFGYNKRVVGLSRKRWMIRLYDRFERVMPGVFKGIGERKLFMDWAVTSAIESGARQVLIIGAGFDTLCLRLAPRYSDVQFIEVDHPATGEAKRRGVEKIGKPDNLALLQADLGERSLSDVLPECPVWSSEVKTVVVAEGLLYYLPHAAVGELFDRIHHCVGAGSSVAFSYMTNHRKHGWARGMLNALSEPWLSSTSEANLTDYIGRNWEVAPPLNPTDFVSELEEFALVTYRD